jgi:hypothetical protein
MAVTDFCIMCLISGSVDFENWRGKVLVLKSVTFRPNRIESWIEFQHLGTYVLHMTESSTKYYGAIAFIKSVATDDFG